jgi:chemotaxis protein methyltransferase CheR
MNDIEFEFISNLLKKRSGLALTKDKLYLLESRLTPIARTHGHPDLGSFIKSMREKNDEKIIAEVVDSMTTNESMFFRDQKPFDQIRNIILPQLKAKGVMGNKIRIWSGACSNGQEPYSLAMCLLEESAKMAGFSYEIVATDISPRVLEKAASGIYTQFEIQRGLPITLMLKYFKQLPENNWQANDTLRQMISFRPKNLLEDITSLGKFDIILCRNVLIYFDEPTKRGVLDKIATMINPNGFLMLGSTETIFGISEKYKNLDNERGIYLPIK